MDAEVAVVGAGPAGLSASIEAARLGAKIVLIDENGKPGGQLFKQIHKFFGSMEHLAGLRGYDIGNKLWQRAMELKINVMLNTTVFGIFGDKTLGLLTTMGSEILRAQRIILATGGSENTIAFPGWTLPGVMGAGAAQTLINVHRVLPGKRILMVGSGNVGLIVSYQLLQAGAEVVALVEAAPKIGGYRVHAAKIQRAGVPIMVSHTVKRAHGRDYVEAATIVRVDDDLKMIPGTEKTFDVDTICLAVGLTPLSELAWMSGCKFIFVPTLGGHVPIHNEDLETTVEGIYVAGDIAGIEEASIAMEEGRLAGIAAAESLGYAREEATKLKKEIKERVQQLRRGPFGEDRYLAKQRIMKVAPR